MNERVEGRKPDRFAEEVCMAIKKVCVIGAGTMGNGIAQVLLQAGYDTVMVATRQQSVDAGAAAIKDRLNKLVEKGRFSRAEVDTALTRLSTSTDIRSAVADADYVIESVHEKADVKLAVYRELDEACPAETIFGSNTSSIPLALLSSATKRPDKVCGMHFINPAPQMKLVEVGRALLTSDETIKTTVDLVKSFNKEPVVVQDSPGFVNNRFCMIIFNEAARILQEGLCSVEEIDKLMRLSINMPMGPFEMIDLVGVDIVVDSSEAIYRETGWERYKPEPILKRMVEIGYLGNKVGKGFYTLFGSKKP